MKIMKGFLAIISDKTIQVNSAAFAISMTDREMVLKLAVLGATLIWTLIKIYKEFKKNNEGGN